MFLWVFQDLSRVVKLCDEMVHQDIHVLAFEVALETFLQEKKFKLVLDLVAEMNERRIPLKEHYFYPLICSYAAEGNDRSKFELGSSST